MEFIEVLKEYANTKLELARKKCSEIERKETERQQAIEQQKEKNLEMQLGISLRKCWAYALNSLQSKTFTHEISENALSNKKEGNFWILSIPVDEEISPSTRHRLEENLVSILYNQSNQSFSAFKERIMCDRNEMMVQYNNAMCGGGNGKPADSFQLSYQNYYQQNFYRLYQLTITNIDCINNMLFIQYQLDDSACNYFHPNNYWVHINNG